MARFDLLKATNALACRLAKWDTQCDARLRRLRGEGDKTCGLHLYTDADLGGCSTTQRSTSG
eukprot:7451689-Lingulodinium_polyedra.AAC.1